MIWHYRQGDNVDQFVPVRGFNCVGDAIRYFTDSVESRDSEVSTTPVTVVKQPSGRDKQGKTTLNNK